MLDPIGGFERMKDFFVSYVETAFRISDERTSRARRDLLFSPNVLATEPFIEPVLRYTAAERPLERLIDDEDALGPISREGREAFVELALSGLFDGEDAPGPGIRRRSTYNPYVHQEKMLARGVRPGQPGIVTSGTGSGKTESFMLPLLAKIADEAVRWPAPERGYLDHMWWRNSNDRYKPRRNLENHGRPAAMRAIILYPMNALVDDQMVRLRKALDSDAARQVMDSRFSGNRVFFGQYNSATPVTGFQASSAPLQRSGRNQAAPASDEQVARRNAQNGRQSGCRKEARRRSQEGSRPRRAQGAGPRADSFSHPSTAGRWWRAGTCRRPRRTFW